MGKYEIVKSADFCGAECDFYSNGDEVGMTALQLGGCLGYSDPIRNINKLVARNEYLKDEEFSVVVKLTTTDGKAYNTRLFTEDGIYEITMLSRTSKAKEFRAFVRKTIKDIRQGKVASVDSEALVKVAECIGKMTTCFESLSARVDSLEKKQQQQRRVEMRSDRVLCIPTIEEIEDYCEYLGEWLDADYFYDYYEAVGWIIGNGKQMKDWKATVRCWLRNSKRCLK